MKTKEIDVWIDNTIHSAYESGLFNHAFTVWDYDISQEFKGMDVIKAKLIIEIPEKKIEITESQLDESLHIIKLVEAKTEKQMKALITVIKKELGFTE